jgi:UDP-N-acetylmuramoylalanine-D-glutamate ligase
MSAESGDADSMLPETTTTTMIYDFCPAFYLPVVLCANSGVPVTCDLDHGLEPPLSTAICTL